MEQIILFAFLVFFPFGQIIRIGIIHPIDLIVGIGAIYAIIKKFPKPKVFKYINSFLWVLIFSWIFGALLFRRIEVFYGLLYLIRLTAYAYFFVFVSNFNDKKQLINSLLIVSIASAVLGWYQYFFYPDLRALYSLGWDDHLGRMVGTFLDPAFLGIILVLGMLIALEKKKKWVVIFFLASIAFTYSRASYLAAFIPLVYKKAWIFVLILVAIILSLPRTEGVGVKLERTFSIERRLNNYNETIQIIRKNTLFGVGFNNICLVKDSNFSNHSCSGADSSLLFILATTGIVGLIAFFYLVIRLIHAKSYQLLGTSFLAIAIHSFFANTLFYPWVMGWLAIHMAASSKGKVEA